jgi:hypothetical protein
MCLDIDRVKTAEHSKIKKNKRLIFYKDFQVKLENSKAYLVTYFQETVIPANSTVVNSKNGL